MNAEVLGQPDVIERMVIGLLADGHLLIEGLPGLAKTRAVKAMAKHLEADFRRIQFTPDLLPSDVTGTDIYYSEGGKGRSSSSPGRSSATSSSPTRSTAPRPRSRPRCSRRWRSAR